MCYGSKGQVSSIVKKYVQEEGGVDWISGKEFWEFISDDPQCVEEIYEISAEVGKTFKDPKGQSFSEVIKNKIYELTNEFEKRFGKSGDTMWKKLLEANS
jgi:hypothetical protein